MRKTNAIRPFAQSETRSVLRRDYNVFTTIASLVLCESSVLAGNSGCRSRDARRVLLLLQRECSRYLRASQSPQGQDDGRSIIRSPSRATCLVANPSAACHMNPSEVNSRPQWWMVQGRLVSRYAAWEGDEAETQTRERCCVLGGGVESRQHWPLELDWRCGWRCDGLEMVEVEMSVCNETTTTPQLLLPCAGGSSARVQTERFTSPVGRCRHTPQCSFAK